MPNNQLIRDHGTLDFSAGDTTTLTLPRSHYYERLNLLADYDVTVNTADTPQNGNGILDLIDRVEVEFDGDTTAKSTDFAMSHFLDTYQYGTRSVFEDVDLSSATQQTGSIQSFVDFTLSPGSYGTMLPSFTMSDLVLKVKWATDSDIADDVTVNDASVAVQSRERRKSTVPNPPSTTTSDIVSSLNGFKERQRNIPLTYDGNKSIDLPTGNVYYAVAVQVLDDDSPSNTLVEDVEVTENGVSTHKESTVDLLRAQDKQQYGLESLLPGFFVLNYGVGGDTDDVVSTMGMDAFELNLDTAGTTPTDPAEARVVTQEIVN
jgi:hypothetical protein